MAIGMPPPVPGMTGTPPGQMPTPGADGGQDGMMGAMAQLSPLANVDTSQAFIIQMRNLDQQVRDIAKQFPAFAQFAEKIMNTLMEAQATIAATMREPEGPVPTTF